MLFQKRYCTFIVVLLVGMGTSSCGIWQPGMDPNGKKLTEKAMPVLSALNQYKSVYGYLPDSLQVLLPDFLTKLPDKPVFFYSKNKALLSFHYSPTLVMGQVSCSATIGAERFACGGYL